MPNRAARANLGDGTEASTDDSGSRLLMAHDDDDRSPASRADLLSTIHEEIVPRLALAHAAIGAEGESCPDARPPPTPEEIAQLADLATASDLDASLLFVEQLARDGLSLDTLLLELVGASARLLGEQWAADTRSFSDVTVGLNILQQVVNVLGPTFEPAVSPRGFVMLVAAPGEQHTLGLHLLGEFLRRAGWGVHVAPTMSETDLVDLVEGEHVDMVGFTVSDPDLLKPLARAIAKVRKASKNPAMLVMVGGALQPAALSALAASTGATHCEGAREAVKWLEHHGSLGERFPKC